MKVKAKVFCYRLCPAVFIRIVVFYVNKAGVFFFNLSIPIDVGKQAGRGR
jgi:hypothetical protein